MNTGTHIWSETYDRQMEDIFKIQDEIATKVIQQLKVSLLGTDLSSVPVNTEAYNLFLESKQLANQKSSESTTNAIKLIKESIAIDSTYAPAWAGLSGLYYDAGLRFVTMPMKDAIKQGKAAAEKAITLDPKDVRGYLNLASFEQASWGFKAANQLLEKAMRLEPNIPDVISTESGFALYSGKMDLAIELQLKTIELDPLDVWNHYNLGLFYWMNGEFTKAEESFNRLLLLHPNDGSANGLMGLVQLSLGHPEKALSYIEKQTNPFWSLYRKSMMVFAMGDIQKANALLKQLVTDFEDNSWPNVADVYAYRGEKDEAFKWLELAFENKDPSLFEILNYPAMQNLWGDPRWNKFINKLGLPKDCEFHMD